MNYASLVAAIGDYTQNNDPVFTAAIPTFIRMAEKRIFREAKMPPVTSVLPFAATASQYLTLTDFTVIASRSLAVVATAGGATVGAPLILKTPELLLTMYPTILNTTPAAAAIATQPLYYSRLDETRFVVAPKPSVAVLYEMVVNKAPVSIVDAVSGTSWLGDNFDTTLLYGALLEAYIYMKGSNDVMANYKGLYDTSLGQMKHMMVAGNLADYR